MQKKISKNNAEPLVIGDLVYHLLYGRNWLGLLLKVTEDEKHTDRQDPQLLGLVRMVPGTEFEFHFKTSLTRFRINDSMGYVSMNWLRRRVMDRAKT